MTDELAELNPSAWWHRKNEFNEDILHCSVDGPAKPGEKIIVDGDQFVVLSAGVCRDLRSGDEGSWTLGLRATGDKGNE